MGKLYDFHWNCSKCGEKGSSIGNNKVYRFCPYCGAKAEVNIDDEWEEA